MDLKMKYFFVDTNLFLQCRDVSDLPWSEISDEQHVQLIVPRAVQHEIDRLKADGNNRRAKRARNTNAYFRQILLSDDEQLWVRNHPRMEVAITFSSHAPASPIDVSGVVLDSARPDDSILLEIISYRVLYPDRDVALLTHDTNPMLTAKRLSIPFQSIPNDWLLGPEPDERDKELRLLKARIGELENCSPIIEFTFGEDAVAVPAKIDTEIVTYPPLSQEEIRILTEEIKAVYPMEQNFDGESKRDSHLGTHLSAVSRLALGSYKPPTIEEIDKYKNVDYPAWLEKIGKKLAELPNSLCVINNKISVILAAANIGNFPAEHAIVRIEVSDGMLIAQPADGDEGSAFGNWDFISPPSPPRGRCVDMAALFGARAKSVIRDYESLISPQAVRRDRNKFYWKPRKPSLPKELWEFECEEFIHKDEPEAFSLELLVMPKKRPSSGLLVITVLAKNLPAPACVKIPLKISYSEGSSMNEARRLCGLSCLG